MRCRRCGKELSSPPTGMSCPRCGGTLSFLLIGYRGESSNAPGVWRYGRSLPHLPPTTLGEADTALLAVGSEEIVPPGGRLYAKVESTNPTGSFKDRGSAVVCAAARALDVGELVIASTGNAGSSMAAYAAREGLELTVLVPAATDAGKLHQLRRHDPRVERVEGGFEEVERAGRERARRGAFPGGSENPLRTEGTKTIAFEIARQMPVACDRVIAPIGTGNLLTSLYKGFRELAEAGEIERRPALDGVQLRSVPPLMDCEEPEVVPADGRSPASGIDIAEPALGDQAVEAIRDTGGILHRVGDAAVLEAQRDLASSEGLGAEPTGAVAVAAYREATERGAIAPEEAVVAPITGHCLKE
ncbi:MAG: pyridoxal-phosphate dependent enzyme [Polyangia bacterium]